MEAGKRPPLLFKRLRYYTLYYSRNVGKRENGEQPAIFEK